MGSNPPETSARRALRPTRRLARDGRSILLVTTEKGRSNLVKVDVASRKIQPLTTGDHDVFGYTATPDASKLAVAIGDANEIGDIYLLDAATRKLTRLTRVNEALFRRSTCQAGGDLVRQRRREG